MWTYDERKLERSVALHIYKCVYQARAISARDDY